MLILTRKTGEAIKIANNITLVVLGVKGSQVRLGIEAPQGVAVDRKEIAERKAAGLPRPELAVEPVAAQDELYGNRTEAEWRQLLVEEQEEREAQGQEQANDAA
ncbi:carbon storage regulator [Pseudomonas sp. Teo4]|uniref:carbon storage regulator n=1 Tax=Pseudomonas sp. Teo4 TaxID=3064528 RepID=UPI002AB838C7|nr:Translational regulator CsrA [Pseudomonas sp. Teo4]